MQERTFGTPSKETFQYQDADRIITVIKGNPSYQLDFDPTRPDYKKPHRLQLIEIRNPDITSIQATSALEQLIREDCPMPDDFDYQSFLLRLALGSKDAFNRKAKMFLQTNRSTQKEERRKISSWLRENRIDVLKTVGDFRPFPRRQILLNVVEEIIDREFFQGHVPVPEPKIDTKNLQDLFLV